MTNTNTNTDTKEQILPHMSHMPHYIMKEIQEQVELDFATGKQELVTIVVMEEERGT